ncbi:hypothetical protein L596_008612 [Steinernema carpocapsae]|uniref:Importin subunit alpha n=1 Tax=Steinernema carpocapsae TaxID=34508 RepID=A0A4V6A6E4_STECR|nr:hypothetical protein L596_008612 [Steinernema carpocapsae]
MVRSARDAFDFAGHIAILGDFAKTDQWTDAYLEVRRRICNNHNVPKEYLYKLTGLLIRGVRHWNKGHNGEANALQSAWALTNLACGGTEQTTAIVEKDGIKHLANVFRKAENTELRNQCMWALANIACENQPIAEKIRNKNVFPKLIELLLDPSTSCKIVKNAVWFINRLVFDGSSSRSRINTEIATSLTEGLIKFMTSWNSGRDPLEDEPIFKDVLYTISELVYQELRHVPLIALNYLGFSKFLISKCPDATPGYTKAALRILGNITLSSDLSTLQLVENGLLDCLYQLLDKFDDPRSDVLIDTFWLLSNVAGCETPVSDHLFSHPKTHIFVRRVLFLLGGAKDRSRRDLLYLILNSFASASPERTSWLLDHGFFNGIEAVAKDAHRALYNERLWEVLLDVLRNGCEDEAFVHHALSRGLDEHLQIAAPVLLIGESYLAPATQVFAKFYSEAREKIEEATRMLVNVKPKRILWRHCDDELVPDTEQIEFDVAFNGELEHVFE